MPVPGVLRRKGGLDEPEVGATDEGGAVAPHRKLSVDRREELAHRFRAGERPEALAEAFGVSVRSVYRTARNRRSETAAKADPALPFMFRAPASEIAAFDELAVTAGLGRRGSALRALLRMAVGLVEVPAGQIDRLHEATVRVSRLGINLNQLARSVHRGKLRLGEEDRVLLRGLVREVEGLRRELKTLHEGAALRRSYAQRVMAREVVDEVGEAADG